MSREETIRPNQKRQKRIDMGPILFLIIFCLLFSEGVAWAATSGPPGSGWTMTFSDEFDGASLDTSRWMTLYRWGERTNASNSELEYYADGNVVVSNGTMKLVAKKESSHGFQYTSGIVCSYFNQTYGYFEGRMKLPTGQGLWPAFWLMPLPLGIWRPEIDIMENIGYSSVYMTYHVSTNYPNGSTSTNVMQRFAESYSGDWSSEFHVFGLLWDPDQLVWYIDGVERFRVTSYIPVSGYNVTGMYMILNLAVGGSWPGSPDSSTVFPAQMEIDYIRAYST